MCDVYRFLNDYSIYYSKDIKNNRLYRLRGPCFIGFDGTEFWCDHISLPPRCIRKSDALYKIFPDGICWFLYSLRYK
jgi:hypothetical protein